MRLIFFVTVVSLLFLFQSCQNDVPVSDKPLGVEWNLIENTLNDKTRKKASFTITNYQKTPLTNKGWTIYFTAVCTGRADTVYSDIAKIEQISGDYFKITPTENFPILTRNKSVTITYEEDAWCIKYTASPMGFYVVFEDEDGTEQEPIAIENTNHIPMDQLQRSPTDKYPIPTPAYVFEENSQLTTLKDKDLSPIIPTPIKFTRLEETFQFGTDYTIYYQKGLENEANFLSTAFEAVLEGNFKMVESNDPSDVEKAIILQLDPKLDNEEAYYISANQNIEIEGGDKVGVFYGIQSLLSAMPTTAFGEKQKAIEVSAFEVEDAPRFEYRGMHLDVARNFFSKESVLKLLDLMAFYKLNKFHFHLTDDEGWRIEISDIPELTEIGGQRGHTKDEKDKLRPAYGSGPTGDTHGSGYFTQADFIEIIKYAQQRHIEVIPEIDMPGHARAAIKSMEAYEARLREAGSENPDFFSLHDPNDESEYLSIQSYPDNVICVCQQSTYNFLEKVVDDIIVMFETANVPLNTIHIGGDEVPHGVWGKSPKCKALMEKDATLNNEEDLTHYFFGRFDDILNKKGLKTAGWEEIALKKEGDKHVPNLDFVNDDFIPYVWNSVLGWGREDLGYQLANAGYPVVLCNASNLYFDFAYDKDPNEPGFYWAGFGSTRAAFDFMPENLFATVRMGSFGDTLDPVRLSRGKAKLEKPNNVLGIQGHLWSETIKGSEMLEYYVLPKMLGLAERAWVQPPAYASLDEQWNTFANTVGQREYSKLDVLFGGFNYRIAPAGAIIDKNQLLVNTNFPGLSIRYTTDGSEPTMESAEWTKAVEVPTGNIKIKVFNKKGRSSRTVVLE